MNAKAAQVVYLISTHAEDTAAYIKILDKLGISYCHLKTADKLVGRASINQALGFMIDFEALFASSDVARRFVFELERCAPTLRMRRNPKSGVISGFINDSAYEGDELFERFIHEYEKGFKRLSVRKEARSLAFYPATINFDKTVERVSSYNVSPNGMYLVTTNPAVELGQKIDLEIFHKDAGSIQAKGEVRWKTDFEETGEMLPGIGIKIEEKDSAYESLLMARDAHEK